MSEKKYDWIFFGNGEHIEDAGITIEYVITADNTQRGTVYRVLMDCCGSVARMSHKLIRQRQRRATKSTTCRLCRYMPIEPEFADGDVTSERVCSISVAEAAAKHAPGYQGWQKPSIVETGSWLWADGCS